MSQMLALFFILPLVAGSLCYLLQRDTRLQFYISLSSFGLQLLLCFLYLLEGAGRQILGFGGWPSELGIAFAFDALSALLVGVNALVFFIGSFFVFAEKAQAKLKGRHTFMLLSFLQLGINGAFLTSDLFNLFVFFEVLLISALVLIVSESRESSRRGAIVYLGMNFFASALLLLGVGILYQQTGALSFELIREKIGEVDRHWQILSAGLLLACFGTKAGLFPLYFWLPRTYPFLSGAVGGIIGGLLTKVGVYAILRSTFVIFPNGDPFFKILLIMSCLSMLLGVFAAFSQKEIRAILSVHVISQVGYIAGAVALAGLSQDPEIQKLALAAAIFYAVHDSIVKSSLYFGASWINVVFKTTKVEKLKGIMHQFPLMSLFFAIPAMSLAGLPPFSGFWAKLSVIQAAFYADNWLYIIAGVLTGVFTFLSMLKIWNQCFLGKASAKLPKLPESLFRNWKFAGGLAMFFILWISLIPLGLFNMCLVASEHFFHYLPSTTGVSP